MTSHTTSPCGPLRGEARVPGDKSITHRGLLFAALAQGVSRLHRPVRARDCLASRRCMEALGLTVRESGETWELHGTGALRAPTNILDAASSGTTARLLCGLLAGQGVAATLTGSAQLRARPMGRVLRPLESMGARFQRPAEGWAPLELLASPPLRGATHALPVASAQVKSALLLAGLRASGPTLIESPGPSRDHSERLLLAMGAGLELRGDAVRLEPGAELSPFDLEVPGDPSSAAFLAAAAALIPGSAITLSGVGLNPTRIGLFEVLRRMGVAIAWQAEGEAIEPLGTLSVASSSLEATTVEGREVVTLIDEVPILALLATQAQGQTVIRDAAELRVKESDRIAATAAGLRALGARIEERADGMVIEGPTRLRGANVDAAGDHRLAMTFLIAGRIAEGETRVEGVETIADSYPGFLEDLEALSSA